ncbi:MAG: hypothetical protein U5L98_08385 [Halomonas sp.]|uniref:hypothetical protein n=1 Tax=Halomonas sp. TaxID=1486246 RepID=UPI002ACDB24C|nr:hypothetical protein [Halomonas sp.]MDZ7852646.1 hypothetical protein [Halomonas sp.]
MSVSTEDGLYFLIGDLVLLRENLEPDKKRGWPITMPGRFYNNVEIWYSLLDVKRRADHILMTHDPSQLGREVYP